MSTASIEELRRNLDAYLTQVQNGEEIVITKDDKSVARLTPIMETDWTNLSLQGLAGAYGQSEPDYDGVVLKETNPEYRA
jgi:prevent-host-death family protein